MRSGLLRKRKFAKASAVRAATGPVSDCQSVERVVVKHDRHVVGGALQVDFDGEAFAHGRADRGGAVLDDAFGPIVQAAMGDRPLQPIKLGHGRRPEPAWA